MGAVTFAGAPGLPEAPAVDGVTSDAAPDLVDEQSPWVATSEGNGAIAPEPATGEPVESGPEVVGGTEEVTAIEVAAPDAGEQTFAGGPAITLSG